MKRIILLLSLFVFVHLSSFSQDAEPVSELYTKGFNDAYNILPYRKSYDVYKLSKTLGRLSQKKQLTQAEIDFIDSVSDYNEGYLNGLYEKYRLDKNKTKENIKPMKDLDGDLTYSQISLPLKEELTTEKEE